MKWRELVLVAFVFLCLLLCVNLTLHGGSSQKLGRRLLFSALGIPSFEKPAPSFPKPGEQTLVRTLPAAFSPRDTILPGDSVPVVVELVFDEHGIGEGVVIIDSVAVQVRVLAEMPRRDCAFFSELAVVGGTADHALGAGWHPLHLGPIDAGLAASAEVPDLDWGALSARGRVRVWSTVEAGAEVGYRFGDSEGLHVGVSAGFIF